MGTTRVSGESQIGARARRARLSALVAASMLPVLAGCSSSSSVDYATDAFPSQSLVDLVKGSKNSSPPAQSAAPPPAAQSGVSAPPAAAGAAPAVPSSALAPAREPPPVAATAAASPPPPAARPPEEADPVAAAYPSVSLIDLLTGARKPGAQ
jgi:hypothetical protein